MVAIPTLYCNHQVCQGQDSAPFEYDQDHKEVQTMPLSRLMLVRRLAQPQQRRLFSAGQSFSSYEYPLATEAPVVTKTVAVEAQAAPRSKVSNPSNNQVRDPADPFDDSHVLSDLEVESIRSLQKKYIPTKLLGSTKIGLEIPPYIPPNVPASSLEVPETKITTLDNGVRVVSQETYGQVCTIGVLGNFGSRHEQHHLGTAHLLELMAFQSTASYKDSVEIQQKLQDWGATSFANSGREQTLWCLDILRPNVEQGMDLLKQVTLQPLLLDQEIEESKRAMQYQAMDIIPELKLGEALQTAAYGVDQQLGKSHFGKSVAPLQRLCICPTYLTSATAPAPLNSIDSLGASTVREYLETNVWKNPEGMVIAGAGIGHDELVDMAKLHFGGLEQSTARQTVASIYRGGECKLEIPTLDGMTRVGVALEVGGWSSNDLVPGCVLQTLLGGGNSFSAGGPGKGMYSRLYRQVLNRYFWAESAESFTAFHGESGLLGISASSTAQKSRDATRVISEHLLKLALHHVSDEELDRARNMLKNNVLTQLESRLVLFEDMGRQVLTYGYRENNALMTAKIDAVTKEDLQQLILRALQKPPTVAAVGDNVDSVPSYTEIKSWFAF